MFWTGAEMPQSSSSYIDRVGLTLMMTKIAYAVHVLDTPGMQILVGSGYYINKLDCYSLNKTHNTNLWSQIKKLFNI